MGKKRVLITYGVDVDAVSGWLGSYGGQDSSNDISRGAPQPSGAIPSFGGNNWPVACGNPNDGGADAERK